MRYQNGKPINNPWRHDNSVEINPKHKISNFNVNRLNYRFAPEDLEVDYGMDSFNASLNKKAYKVSDMKSDFIEEQDYKVNKGKPDRASLRRGFGSRVVDLLESFKWR